MFKHGKDTIGLNDKWSIHMYIHKHRFLLCEFLRRSLTNVFNGNNFVFILIWVKITVFLSFSAIEVGQCMFDLFFFYSVKSLNVGLNVIDSQLSVFETGFTLNTFANINIGILISKSVKVYFISEG